MYKLLTLGTLLVGLALAPVLTNSVDEQLQDDNVVLSPRQLDARDARAPEEAAPVDEARACEWECRACEPGQGCAQICAEVGDCGSACGMIAQCDSDHAWDEGACACK